jgi:hypothetical protein
MHNVKEVAYISADFSRAREMFSMLLRSDAMVFSSAALAANALDLQSFCVVCCARSFSASVLYFPGSASANRVSGGVDAAGAQAAKANIIMQEIERHTICIQNREGPVYI